MTLALLQQKRLDPGAKHGARQKSSKGRAAAGTGLQQVFYEPVNFGAEIGGWGGVVASQNFHDESRKGAAFERARKTNKLIQYATNGPHVAALAVGAAIAHLRAEVVRCAYHCVRHVAAVGHDARDAEIGNLDNAAASEKHISAFEVSVHDVVGMNEIQTANKLSEYVQHEVFRQIAGPPTAPRRTGIHELVQVTAISVIHYNIERAIAREAVVICNDVGVDKSFEYADFLHGVRMCCRVKVAHIHLLDNNSDAVTQPLAQNGTPDAAFANYFQRLVAIRQEIVVDGLHPTPHVTRRNKSACNAICPKT